MSRRLAATRRQPSRSESHNQQDEPGLLLEFIGS